MALFRIVDGKLIRLQSTTFEIERIMETAHLQAYIRDNISVIESDVDLKLMVLEEEYSDWEDSNRSIDLLCVDSEANLVVVELKRTRDGGHMELQALRYAAMVSTMTFEDASRAHERFRKSHNIEGPADEAILEFLGWNSQDEMEFADDVRIILASQGFSDELVTSIMWLSDHEIDIQCFKMAPYQHNDEILVNIDQIFPLPEAEDYQVKIREKERKERTAKHNRDMTRFDLKIGDQVIENLPKLRLAYQVVHEAISRGNAPRDVLPQKKAWIAILGELNSDEFLELSSTGRDKESTTANIASFFTETDKLFHYEGKTYALKSDIWGPNTRSDLNRIIETFDMRDVKYIERPE